MTPEQAPLPRGIRNNNPGNIRRSATHWQGMAETQTDPDFVVFADPIHGIRAMAVILRHYAHEISPLTIRTVIGRWAPPNENATETYIGGVAEALSISPDQQIDLGRSDVLGSLVTAIIHYENGQQPYSGAQMADAIALALGTGHG